MIKGLNTKQVVQSIAYKALETSTQRVVVYPNEVKNQEKPV
jgi:hypothetical protein